MGSVQAPDFNTLRTQLEGTAAEVLTPDSTGYAETLVRWSDTCEKKAAAVTLPRTASEVSTIIKFASTNNVPFVVHCGGHSTSSASATENGIVIDLRKMRSVSVDSEAKTITCGGGSLWADVDTAAAAKGLATVGGTVNHTGVGGLALGGGYGWLTGQYGLTVDNMISCEAVLADGSIVTASETENSDLFWALRGAGACFAVVTQFVFKAYPQTETVYAGLLAFAPDKIPAVVDFANHFHETTDGKQGLVFGFSAPPPANAPVLLAAVFHGGENASSKGAEYFKPLLDLEPLVNGINPTMPYEQVNGMLNHAGAYGGRKIFGGANVKFPLKTEFMQALFEKLNAFTGANEGTNESLVILELMGGLKMIRARGNEEMAFCNRGDYYQVGTCFKWYKEEQDTLCRKFNREMNQWITQEGGSSDPTKREGVGVYANYVGDHLPTTDVFGKNSAKLQELKRKYDPQNLFSRWHNLLPKQTA